MAGNNSNIEIWKDSHIKNVQVSSLGRVKKGCELLTLYVNDKGYISTRINNKIKQVHRIIAKAFIENPKKLPQVDHINGDKTDNNIKNLRWVTQSENMINLYRNGYRPNLKRKLTAADIPEIRELKNKGYSNREIGEMFGVTYKQISNICNGWRWRHIKTPFDTFRDKGNPNKPKNSNQLLLF